MFFRALNASTRFLPPPSDSRPLRAPPRTGAPPPTAAFQPPPERHFRIAGVSTFPVRPPPPRISEGFVFKHWRGRIGDAGSPSTGGRSPRRRPERLLQPGDSRVAAKSVGSGGGTVCLEHGSGYTGSGAVRRLRRGRWRVPATGRWRGRHGPLWRKCQPRVRCARGGSRPGSSPGPTVEGPAGFREGGPPGGNWTGEALRRPEGIPLPSFSNSGGSALFSSSAYASRSSPGELRAVVLVSSCSWSRHSPLVLSASGSGGAAFSVGTVAFRPLQPLLRKAFFFFFPTFAALPTQLLLMFVFTPFSF